MAGVVLSCGILVLASQGELLLCHATGTSRWDIPKGVGEVGETELQVALREADEETGLKFEPDSLLDALDERGVQVQVLAFAVRVASQIDTAQCVCTTQFRDAHGRLRPEMDAFEWVPFAEVAQPAHWAAAADRCAAHFFRQHAPGTPAVVTLRASAAASLLVCIVAAKALANPLIDTPARLQTATSDPELSMACHAQVEVVAGGIPR